MSFFTELKTFGHWAEIELGKLSTEAPKIEAVADTALQYTGGAASIIAGLEGGPAASAAVNSFVKLVTTGSVALNGLITDFGANPTTSSIASSLATNASALLSAAEVKNPASMAAGTKIITNLTNLATALSAASTAPAARTRSTRTCARPSLRCAWRRSSDPRRRELSSLR